MRGGIHSACFRPEPFSGSVVCRKVDQGLQSLGRSYFLSVSHPVFLGVILSSVLASGTFKCCCSQEILLSQYHLDLFDPQTLINISEVHHDSNYETRMVA